MQSLGKIFVVKCSVRERCVGQKGLQQVKNVIYFSKGLKICMLSEVKGGKVRAKLIGLIVEMNVEVDDDDKVIMVRQQRKRERNWIHEVKT